MAPESASPSLATTLSSDNNGAITGNGLELAKLMGQYTNAAALVMVGWVLYQTIGVELPGMREQTFNRTQAIVHTLERMADRIEEQSKLLNEMAREFRELRLKKNEGL